MGQQINKTVWLSDDGKKEFDTQADMIAYESRNRWQALVTTCRPTSTLAAIRPNARAKRRLRGWSPAPC